MVEFKKSARTKGEWIWIHDGSPVYTVDSDLKTWTKVEYTGTNDSPDAPSNTAFWNPFDGKRGPYSGGMLTALESGITTEGSEHYMEGTLNGTTNTKVMYFKHGRAQEGTWEQDTEDNKFVDFSTARIGCWVSDQKSFTIASGLTELQFNNVDLQGRYPKTGFLAIEGIKLDSSDAMDWKLGDMTVYEDSSGDDDVRVLLEPDDTAGIAVKVHFGSESSLAELLGTDSSTLSYITVYAYPRDEDSDDGFGTGIRYATNAASIDTSDNADDYYENDFTAAFATALTAGIEYEIRLQGGSGQTTDVGNEVVVGIATAGADNPSFTRVYNMTHGVKVFGVKWAITDDGGNTLAGADGNTMKARAVVFG